MSMGSNQQTELLKLDASERFSIAEKLWASVSADDEPAEPSNGEIAFVKARLELYLKNPNDTVSWTKIREELGF